MHKTQATDLQSQAEMQAFMRDTLTKGLIDDVQELRKAVTPPDMSVGPAPPDTGPTQPP